MRGIYEIVLQSNSVSFTFQIYNGYTGLNKHKLLMRYKTWGVLFGNAEGDKQSRTLKIIQTFYTFQS